MGLSIVWAQRLSAIGLSVFATALTVGLRLSLIHLIGSEASMLLFVLPLLVVASARGVFAGVTTVILSAISGDFFFNSPLYSFRIVQIREWEELVLFCIVGTLISFFAGRLRVIRLSAQTNYQLAEEAKQALGVAYQRERHIAETLQNAFLLMPDEDSIPGLQMKSFYLAVLDEARVGGDFSDAVVLPSGRVALVIGDITGKGLAAAFHVTQIKMALRAYLYEYQDVNRALSLLNNFLYDMTAIQDPDSAVIVPMVVAIFDPLTGALEVSVAGSEPPIIVHGDGTITVVSAQGLLLALFRDTEYPPNQYLLQPEEVLVLCTDGITEARRGVQFFGSDGLACAARNARIHTTLSEIGTSILEEVHAFSGGHQVDDICLLLARRT